MSGQPLIAQATRDPLTRRYMTRPSMSAGRATTIMTAAATPQCTPPPDLAKKDEAPTVIGTASRVVNIRPNMNSFQAVMEPKTTVLTSVGRTSGRMTRSKRLGLGSTNWLMADFPFPRTDLSPDLTDGSAECGEADEDRDADLKRRDLTTEVAGGLALTQQPCAVHPIVGETVPRTVF